MLLVIIKDRVRGLHYDSSLTQANRHLTIVEAATRLVTLLVKQWNYLFYTGSSSSPGLQHRDDTIQRSKGIIYH